MNREYRLSQRNRATLRIPYKRLTRKTGPIADRLIVSINCLRHTGQLMSVVCYAQLHKNISQLGAESLRQPGFCSVSCPSRQPGASHMTQRVWLMTGWESHALVINTLSLVLTERRVNSRKRHPNCSVISLYRWHFRTMHSLKFTEFNSILRSSSARATLPRPIP